MSLVVVVVRRLILVIMILPAYLLIKLLLGLSKGFHTKGESVPPRIEHNAEAFSFEPIHSYCRPSPRGRYG